MARSGMTALIEELRSLTEAGSQEYQLGTTTYWSDNTLQDLLDINRTDLAFQLTASYPKQVQGGSLQWLEYRSSYGFFEQTTGGTDIFYLQDSTGATLGTALWGADYRRGVVTFVSTTSGTSFYLTGRSYDLNATAADVWRRKAAHYAPSSFDFSTDNHRINRAQIYDHALEMASYYEGMGGNSIQTVNRNRSDAY